MTDRQREGGSVGALRDSEGHSLQLTGAMELTTTSSRRSTVSVGGCGCGVGGCCGGGGFTPPIQHLGQTWANYGKLEEIILIGIKS